MRKFLNDSFKNGNRFTNILLSFVSLLLGLMAYFGAQMYSKQDKINDVTIANHGQIQVIINEIDNFKKAFSRLETDVRDDRLDLIKHKESSYENFLNNFQSQKSWK